MAMYLPRSVANSCGNSRRNAWYSRSHLFRGGGGHGNVGAGNVGISIWLIGLPLTMTYHTRSNPGVDQGTRLGFRFWILICLGFRVSNFGFRSQPIVIPDRLRGPLSPLSINRLF